MCPKIVKLAFDTETTGLPEDGPVEILSFACIGLSEDLTQVFRRQIFAFPSSDALVHPKAAEVNGYTRERWAEKGAVSQDQLRFLILEIFEEYQLDRAIPLGHNVSFDLDRLSELLPRDVMRKALAYHKADTMCSAIMIDDAHGIRNQKYNLTVLCERYGIPLSGAHDSLADIVATVELYEALLRVIHNPAKGEDAPKPPGPASVLAKGHFPFGKHAGVPLEKVPPGYLHWARANLQNLTDADRQKIAEVLGG